MHLIHWGNNAGSISHLKYYNPNFNVYKKPSDFKSLSSLVDEIDAKVIVISGWLDLSYLAVALKYRTKGYKVICCMDTQYTNSFKQKLGSFIFNINTFRRLFFTNVWIPGFPQFEAAIRFGFNYSEIIFCLLSGDTNVFSNRSIVRTKTRKFLFVGRLEKVKGIDQLIDAWNHISKLYPDWELVVAGEGSLKSEIMQLKNVIHKGFLNPYEVSSIMNECDCLLLPSNYEPWGLVIHEAVLCGLPIICTENCGASSVFLIDKYNGFVIKEGQRDSLYDCMIKFINLGDDDFINFSSRSVELGSQISTDISAAHFNSKMFINE